MPFQDGVFYPYASDGQSSEGTPSVLNSPFIPAMTPSSGGTAATTTLPFRFRPRRDSVDWRRLNAVDVDLVASQLDVEALQENVDAVAFCRLDEERCPRCRGPVDPALVKLLRLAQLTVEWVLHCQEVLALNLRGAEERLAAGEREREKLAAELKKRDEREKELVAELKQRRKVIRTQQSLLAPQRSGSHKCLYCEKAFLSPTFLRDHVQRRHPDDYKSQLQSDNEKRSQIDGLKSEISGQKERIVQLQQALQAKTAQEKEQQSLYKDLLSELQRFKAEEMARVERKIEDSRDGMRREMEFLYSRNIQALNEVNQNQPVRQVKSISPVNSQPERDVDTYKELQTQANEKLEQQIRQQDKKWESRLQEMKSLHEAEKKQLLDELSQMRSNMAEQQEVSRRSEQETGRRLQDMKLTIQAQKEQIKSIFSNPPTKVVEVPGTPPPPPSPPNTRSPSLPPSSSPACHRLEEPVSAVTLDPIQELSEDEKESSSFSERKSKAAPKRKPKVAPKRKPKVAPEKKPEPAPKKKKNNPGVKRVRPKVMQMLAEKLEKLGVQPDQSRLKKKALASILASLRSKQATAEYWSLREELSGAVEKKLSGQRRGSDPVPESQARSRHPAKVLQIRPRSSSLPSTASHPAPAAAVRQRKTPEPAAVRQRKTPEPAAVRQRKTPEPAAVRQRKTPEPAAVKQRKTPELAAVRQRKIPELAAVKQPKIPEPAPRTKTTATAQPKRSTPNSRTATTFLAVKTPPLSSDEETDADVKPPHLRGGKSSPAVVRAMVAATETPAAKPESKEEESEWSDFSDVEEIDLEGRSQGKNKGPESPSTSVWTSSTEKPATSGLAHAGTPSTLKSSLEAPKSGLANAGTASTLKSSLWSLSDFSD